MKKILNKLIKGEGGQALILVLILMLLGGLIITPLLSYMSTGLKVGQVHENLMDELYAADAGVENAVWKLKTPTNAPLPLPGSSSDATPALLNGMKTMDVKIFWISGVTGAGTYKIISVASADVSSTTIESYVQTFPFFWANTATSCNDVNIKPGGVVDPPIVEDYDPGKWPFTPDVNQFYWDQVTGYLFPGGTLDVKDTPVIGPTYTNGGLTIKKTGTTGNTLLTLEGTLYVKGNLKTDQTKEFTIDLNYHTIYCEANTTGPPYAINIGGDKTTIKGSGCIVAIGDINFQPSIESKPGDFIFIMSVSGRVWFHPNGDFYGSVAGNADIDLWPNNTFTHTDPPRDSDGNIMLNFPMEDVESAVKILTWEIKLN